MKAITEAKGYSDNRIDLIRGKLAERIRNDSIGVCVVGSYGRREASPQSDLDFFLLNNTKGSCDAEIEIVRDVLHKVGIKMPSADGAFNSYAEVCDEMARNIGGIADKAEKLTRRLLFLLEGDWLYNEGLFNKCFNSLIEQYVRDTIRDHQLCRFLLNDLIRYYRTICVDFEFKTHENGKPWGDRNIKLQFSRKLLYFSGILVVAETWQRDYQSKREVLQKYLRQTPLERIHSICGSLSESGLNIYDEFLVKMAQDEVRQMLQRTTDDRQTHTEHFRAFKNEGRRFTAELSRLLANKYDEAHPIHLALKF